jgi:hypothetical protein
MAFHIPFNQRHNYGENTPVYIGFDVPAARPRRKFNWWGFNGMWMSFVSLLTGGFLSPLPLLVSLNGLRRPGKKMATIGTLTSLGGIGLAAAIVMGLVASHQHSIDRQQSRVIKKQIAEAQSLLGFASNELVEYRQSNDGRLPGDVDANMLVIKHVDPWTVSLRFDEEVDFGTIRSAGPDRVFYTKDDVTKRIDGKTDRVALLPVDK